MVQSCSIERAVDDVLARLPMHIHLGLPLGLGKANRFVNALYQRIKLLPERRLTIYTALSLGRPPLGDGLQLRLRRRASCGSRATSCATRFKPLALISRAAWL